MLFFFISFSNFLGKFSLQLVLQPIINEKLQPSVSCCVILGAELVTIQDCGSTYFVVMYIFLCCTTSVVY